MATSRPLGQNRGTPSTLPETRRKGSGGRTGLGRAATADSPRAVLSRLPRQPQASVGTCDAYTRICMGSTPEKGDHGNWETVKKSSAMLAQESTLKRRRGHQNTVMIVIFTTTPYQQISDPSRPLLATAEFRLPSCDLRKKSPK